MRITACLLVLLLLGLAAPLAPKPVGSAKVTAATIQSSAPQIISVRRQGKKLFVLGENFDMGAVILLNGEAQKTANDESNPTSLLVAKKAGKRIGPTDIVTIEVLNADNQKSPDVSFFGGTTITRADAGKSVALALHEEFLVALDGNFEWGLSFSDPNAFVPIPVVQHHGIQGLFRADAQGTYKLMAQGEPPCVKLNPPCQLIPVLVIEIKLTVE
ncbi:MAG TPA: hypothetical protein VKA60_24495 [Blastocatellia bacterium]|nr:hypothetical protein [Blastocatellia bacterium]